MAGTEERPQAVDTVLSSSSTTATNSPAVSVTSPSIPRQTAPTAAPNATNIQNSIESSGPRKNGVPAGAVAGVAIGCLIAGAAIGALILFFLRRRKSRNGSAVRQRPLEYGNGHLRLEKTPVVTTTLVTSSVDNYLPQPLEDAAITREVSMISDHLKNHVRAYYHTHPAKAEDINEADLGAFSSATELETSEAKRLFLDQSTRSETIRLFLAWTILSRCDGTRPQNLLPSGVSAIMQSGSPAKESNLAEATLFSKWKVITGTLLTKQPTLSPNAIADTIAEAAMILGPFTRKGIDREQRLKNLEMVVGRAASLAWTLFTQPGSYRFDFRGSRDSVVAFPALLQMTGDDARVVSPPRVLWEKEIVA
ncbi:hypothetical protein GRF29_154g385665 [Pseudopithomyces chartarum]|uniref:Uncharacterized protein n=1 Tax=Pseudopithomyces chartarum TaxID=1892770 RepID=A0AAN6RDN6_9PLEO|nr:hypothetical protein GRF29_154g385665 [Pseudopithomyces chartarum]